MFFFLLLLFYSLFYEFEYCNGHYLIDLLQEADDIINVENFHETVMFGTVDTTVEGSLLSVLENVYAPIFFNATTWPDSILTKFFLNFYIYVLIFVYNFLNSFIRCEK